ncbi:MAG: hypothetical protein JSV83_00030 [Desulfobacterales bacterium]|nr:MAG: hypothetical protein JSV83_00030 [Desulfobacterales bacterium]
MRKLIVIVFLSSMLLASIKTSFSAVLPSDLLGRNSSIKSMMPAKGMDYWVEVIEENGIQLATVTTFQQNNCNPLSTFKSHNGAMSTCYSVFADVMNGPVEMDFVAFDGRFATIIVNAGDGIEFKPDSFTISSPISNSDEVLVLVDGVKFLVNPGESNQIVTIDIMPVSKSTDHHQDNKEVIPVVIFGSAYLDVSNIDVNSLVLDGLAVKRDEQSNNLASIDHVNDDRYPDLVVNFENNHRSFSKDFSFATLTGNLSNGTIISGNDYFSISP